MRTIVQGVASHPYERILTITCDMCHVTVTGDTWAPDTFTIAETKVSYKHGTTAPYWDGGGEYTKLFIDICPSCFVSRLLPWLKTQGVSPHTEEVDW